MIALKARVPLVPCYIRGCALRRHDVGLPVHAGPVRLDIGQPIDLSPYYDRDGEREVLDEITCRVLREIAGLAGNPDFQPQLAGRVP